MPFLTEEIWQFLKTRTPDQALIVSSWPASASYDTSLLEEFHFASEVISGIRNLT